MSQVHKVAWLSAGLGHPQLLGHAGQDWSLARPIGLKVSPEVKKLDEPAPRTAASAPAPGVDASDPRMDASSA
jgi:hypothetical protein